jgi:hypothetical protein
MWIVDNPWPPFFLLMAGAILCAWRWSQTGSPRLAIVAGSLLIAAALVHVADWFVITESEVVEERVHQLVTAFQKKDLKRTQSLLAPNVTPSSIPSMIRSAMNFVVFDGDIDVKDMRVEMQPDNNRAVSRFRANARVTYQGDHKDFQPSRWELTWQRPPQGEWQVIRVKRLDPLSDREVSLFYPLEGDHRR